MTSKYADPENKQEIIENLKNCPTIGDVKKTLDTIFPNWIVTILPSYSNDYPELNKNWDKVCSEINVKPAKILIVEDMSFDEEYTLIRTFAEIFTKSGFSVRRKLDFIPCSKCNKGIPVLVIYEFMKTQNKTIPKVYSKKCSTC